MLKSSKMDKTSSQAAGHAIIASMFLPEASIVVARGAPDAPCAEPLSKLLTLQKHAKRMQNACENAAVLGF